MAVKILKGEADISTMAIEYYPNPVKKYNPDMACLLYTSISFALRLTRQQNISILARKS